MVDLSPCPFCGSTNLRYEFAGSQGYIECNECGTEGPCDERAADPICDCDAACDAWNRRAALAEQPVGPTDEELWATGDDDFRANYYPTDAIRYARAVLVRWGQPAHALLDQSVAVAPTDEELDSVMFQAVWGCMDNASDLTNDEMDRLKARAVLAKWGHQ